MAGFPSRRSRPSPTSSPPSSITDAPSVPVRVWVTVGWAAVHGTLDLLEREEELSALDAALARARAWQGQVVVVEGPGGIGKTRLLAAARGTAREGGMRTLYARASELERSLPSGSCASCSSPPCSRPT